MSAEFTASNGVSVRRGRNTRLLIAADGTIPNTVVASDSHIDALREFFQHERDEALGRWRWAENPDYVVYSKPTEDHALAFGEGLDLVILRESDGGMKGYVAKEDDRDRTAPTWACAARAYLKAHPEPKPWDQAAEGEVWALTFALGDSESAWVRKGDDWATLIDDTSLLQTVFAPITAGRRIWPEVSS